MLPLSCKYKYKLIYLANKQAELVLSQLQQIVIYHTHRLSSRARLQLDGQLLLGIVSNIRTFCQIVGCC